MSDYPKHVANYFYGHDVPARAGEYAVIKLEINTADQYNPGIRGIRFGGFPNASHVVFHRRIGTSGVVGTDDLTVTGVTPIAVNYPGASARPSAVAEVTIGSYSTLPTLYATGHEIHIPSFAAGRVFELPLHIAVIGSDGAAFDHLYIQTRTANVACAPWVCWYDAPGYDL